MAEVFLLVQKTDDLAVKGFWEVLFDKFFSKFIELILTQPPEVIEKNALHPLGADDFGEGEKRDKCEEVEASDRHAFQHKITKKQLGVPGDECLIEIKQCVALMDFSIFGRLRLMVVNGAFIARQVKGV